VPYELPPNFYIVWLIGFFSLHLSLRKSDARYIQRLILAFPRRSYIGDSDGKCSFSVLFLRCGKACAGLKGGRKKRHLPLRACAVFDSLHQL